MGRRGTEVVLAFGDSAECAATDVARVDHVFREGGVLEEVLRAGTFGRHRRRKGIHLFDGKLDFEGEEMKIRWFR